MTPEQAGAFLTVDLNKIAENWRTVQTRVGDKTRAAAVLKTDAYGLDARKVGQALYRAGCRIFFTAYVFEAIALREVLPDATIYVLHGVLPHTELDFLRYNLIPVLSTPRQLFDWNHLGHKENITLPAALHINTGMTRLGLSETDVAALCKNVPAYLNISLVISHLACADNPENPKNVDQLNRFDTLCERLKTALPKPFLQSLSATDGSLLADKSFYKDIVRAGIALYDDAVSLEAKILQIQEVEAGQTVGYGATHAVKEKARIATLAIGYGDGYPRTLADKGYVWLAERKVPVVGRISMDLTTVDVTGIDDGELKLCPTAEIIGEHCPIKEIANLAGTIDYELLTNLSSRFYRIYMD